MRLHLLLLVWCLTDAAAMNKEVSLPLYVVEDYSDVFTATISSFYGSKATCEFSYVSEKHKAEKKVRPSASSSQISNDLDLPQKILDRLMNVCIQKEIDYWTYEVCIGYKVSQFHGPHVINLGKYSSTTSGFNQFMSNGDGCEALPHENYPPRKSVVEYFCGEKTELVSVEEIETCQYKFVVSTKQFCASSFFPKVKEVKDEKTKDDHDAFLLEMFEVDYPKDQVVCRVKKVIEKSSVTLKDFKLSLTTSGDERTELLPVRHIVRDSERADLELARGMYHLEVSPEQHKLTLASMSQGFQGDVAYVAVQALIAPKG